MFAKQLLSYHVSHLSNSMLINELVTIFIIIMYKSHQISLEI